VQHIRSRLETLTRPRLLVRAARFALDDYRRDIHLKRVLRRETPPPSFRTLANLLAIEEDLETSRRAADASYSPPRHVEALAALMHEARLLASAEETAGPTVSRAVPLLVC
jgi:hypothetical protein